MKYQQPYGVTDPNAPYINGNPSTGQMGSIPPAGSIEYPQREIVNFIASSGIVPGDADLFQLARGVQNGRVMYGIDTGAANIVSVSLAPVPDQLTDGMIVRVRISNQNTGPSVLQCNAFGGKGIVHPDQGPMQPGELKAGMYCEFIYDHPHDTFQLIGSQGGTITTPDGPAQTLLAPRDYYVNGNTGSDSNDGLTAAKPFLTIQKALNQLRTINTNGWNVTIHVADFPNYNGATCLPITGSGSVFILGNPANPQNVCITGVGVNVPALAVVASAGTYYLRGLKLQANVDCGLRVFPNSTVYMYDMEFGVAPSGHYQSFGGTLGIFGLAEFQAPGSGLTWVPRIYISGNTNAHSQATTGAFFDMHAPDLIFRGSYSIGNWVRSDANASSVMYYNSITGAPAGGCVKYVATLNGVITTGGRGPASIPGDTAGVLSTGGQFN